MNQLWSPENWDDFSTVGLLVFIVAFHFLAYLKRWIIPGSHHNEIVQARDREIAELREARREDAKTIHLQSQAITKTTAAEDTATQLLAAVRDIAERARG